MLSLTLLWVLTESRTRTGLNSTSEMKYNDNKHKMKNLTLSAMFSDISQPARHLNTSTGVLFSYLSASEDPHVFLTLHSGFLLIPHKLDVLEILGSIWLVCSGSAGPGRFLQHF